MRIHERWAEHLRFFSPVVPGSVEAMPTPAQSDAIVLDVVEISSEAVILQTRQGNELVLVRYFPEVKLMLASIRLNMKV
jgi:hypothetical protein